MKPPTVAPLLTNQPAPVVTGTYDSATAKSLIVKVGPTAFELGKAAGLSASGDAWRLALPALGDGDYDVSAETGDGKGLTVSTAAPSTLTIDTVPPSAPVIGPIAGGLPVKASGTWPEGDAVSLAVRLAGQLWQLGKDAALDVGRQGQLDLRPGHRPQARQP